MNVDIGNEAAEISFLGIFVSNFRYSAQTAKNIIFMLSTNGQDFC
jgi:hypothetical protein